MVRFHRKGFTLIELLIGFLLAMFILSVFYLMHGTYQVRLVKLIQKSRGQQAVRLLMTKLRQELKGAVKVYVPTGPQSMDEAPLGDHQFNETRNDILVIQMGRSNIRDYPGYTVQYEYLRDKKAILYKEFKNGNQLVKERLFLGGNTQILGFHVRQTDKTEQILIQKHKVDVELEYFDTAKLTKSSDGREMVVPLRANLTVYPRPINMLLRIDVPQG